MTARKGENRRDEACPKTKKPASHRRHRLEEGWWPEAGSNRRHRDFQSLALPTELSCHKKRMAYLEGFEPPTFWSVARRSIQLSYRYACFITENVTNIACPRPIASRHTNFFLGGRATQHHPHTGEGSGPPYGDGVVWTTRQGTVSEGLKRLVQDGGVEQKGNHPDLDHALLADAR